MPLVTVHVKVLIPGFKFVIPEVGFPGASILIPGALLQEPEPMAGVKAFIVAEFAHTVWLGPASAGEGLRKL